MTIQQWKRQNCPERSTSVIQYEMNGWTGTTTTLLTMMTTTTTTCDGRAESSKMETELSQNTKIQFENATWNNVLEKSLKVTSRFFCSLNTIEWQPKDRWIRIEIQNPKQRRLEQLMGERQRKREGWRKNRMKKKRRLEENIFCLLLLSLVVW